jgi:hypothetical protein
MIEMQVELDFACSCCGAWLNVKLKCAGKGLAGGGHSVAAVDLPCPNCENVNQLCFEPSGTVRAVRPSRHQRGLPVPSLN